MKNFLLFFPLLLFGCFVNAVPGLSGPLVLWYSFDNISSPVLEDHSENGLNGEIYDSILAVGQKNDALYFQPGSYVKSRKILDHLVETREVTVEFWVNLNNVTAGHIVSHSSSFSVEINGGHIELYGIWYLPPVISSNTLLTTGVWYHVALTLSPNGAKIFINGVEDNVVADVRNLRNLSHNCNCLELGGKGMDGFDGMLDELRVYDTARTSAQILDAYNRTK